MLSEFRALGRDWVWLVVAVVSSAAGALLIYIAIGEKNATLASFIEISYPFFVAVFAWLFFRETQFSWPTVFGGLLILGGVASRFPRRKACELDLLTQASEGSQIRRRLRSVLVKRRRGVFLLPARDGKIACRDRMRRCFFRRR